MKALKYERYLDDPPCRLLHVNISGPPPRPTHVRLDPAGVHGGKARPWEVLGEAGGQHVEGGLGAPVGGGVGGGGLRYGEATHAGAYVDHLAV